MQQITPQTARRLAISKQQLNLPRQENNKARMTAVLRQIHYLQLDPINVVARNPLLVLWSRLGNYDPADLNELLWDDKTLFEYWAHAASIVFTEDYPIFQPWMRRFATGDSKWVQRVQDWLAANAQFRQGILTALAQRGPLFANEIENRAVVSWGSSGWTNARDVTVMLGFLWEQGEVMVSHRPGKGFGLKKRWALAEHHLPEWVNHEERPLPELVAQSTQMSLQALGVGTAKHIKNHFTRGRYPGLDGILEALVADGRVHPIQIAGDDGVWPETWYIHADDLHLLAQIERGEWQPATRLLSPFDNLICDRERTELLFDFYYRSEIYTPKAKRQYGYYVMPILHGDRLIGRIDPKIDRKKKKLHVFAVHVEPGMKVNEENGRSLAAAVNELAQFLGAADIQYGSKLPAGWRSFLR